MQLQIAVLVLCSAYAAALSVSLRAIGIGVTDRNKATIWYRKAFGINKVMELKLGSNPTLPFDEDILGFGTYDKRGSSLVLMEWKDKVQRSVKDLPIKLQFSVPDVKKAQDQIVANGGPIVDVKSSEIPGALYAKDPDGYLLELVPSNTTGSFLSGVTIGTSDVVNKAEFWTKTTQMKSTEIRKLSEGDVFTLSGADFGATLSFVQLNETPKRSTVNLPYKIVVSVDKGNDYAAAVKSLGGKEILPIAMLGGTIGFVEEPNDRSTIEINSGAIRGPP